MQQRRRFKQSAPLDQRLRLEAERLRKEAQGTPAGLKRDRLLRKARQLETTSHLDEWLASRGQQNLT